jgi:hypothetical protein
MTKGLDCKYILSNIPLNHFYQTVFLVYMLFMFSFLSECNLSDLWIPEAMEFFFSIIPIFHGSSYFLSFPSCMNVISLIYGSLR